MSSILESLAKYRAYGHVPRDIGEVTIGRTVYAGGRFTHNDGTARIVLIPIYRTDWVRWNSAGPEPALLPASHKRGAVYVIDGVEWFIAGWSDTEAWLSPVTVPSIHIHARTGAPYRRIACQSHWKESFECAMSLAGPDVLARIAEQEN